MERKQRHPYNKSPTTWTKRNVCHPISSVLAVEPYLIFQETNCGRGLTNGSPPRTRQRTTTLHVILITRIQQHGFFKARSIKNGGQQARFFGSMENVCPLLFPTRFSLIPSCLVAGSGKSVIWFVEFNQFLSDVTDVPCQFHGDPRQLFRVPGPKRISRLFLL